MQILPGMGETVIYQKYQEQLTSNLLYVLHKHLIYGLGEPVNPKLDVFGQCLPTWGKGAGIFNPKYYIADFLVYLEPTFGEFLENI